MRPVLLATLIVCCLAGWGAFTWYGRYGDQKITFTDAQSQFSLSYPRRLGPVEPSTLTDVGDSSVYMIGKTWAISIRGQFNSTPQRCPIVAMKDVGTSEAARPANASSCFELDDGDPNIQRVIEHGYASAGAYGLPTPTVTGYATDVKTTIPIITVNRKAGVTFDAQPSIMEDLADIILGTTPVTR